MKLVLKDHWQGEQIPKLISFLSVKMMSFRGYFPVLGLWLPSPLEGSKCRILLELSTKSMTWNRNSGMHEPIVLASIEPRPKSPKLLSPQVNGMKAALWEPILFILTARFHITQGYCFCFLLSFILHKMLSTFMSIFILLFWVCCLYSCASYCSHSTDKMFDKCFLAQFASKVCHGGNGGRNTTWSHGQRVLLAGAPGHVDTECYTLRHLVTWTQSVTCWASGHMDTECYLLELSFLFSCRIWAHGMLLSTLRVRLSCSGKPFRNSLRSRKYVSMVTLNLVKLVVRFNLNLTQFRITRAQ